MKEILFQFILNLTPEEVDMLVSHYDELKSAVNKRGENNVEAA